MRRKQGHNIGRDSMHIWANLIVGVHIPRSFIRNLSEPRYRRLIAYVRYIWLSANDNYVKRIDRPSWLPKKYIWGDTSSALRS